MYNYSTVSLFKNNTLHKATHTTQSVNRKCWWENILLKNMISKNRDSSLWEFGEREILMIESYANIEIVRLWQWMIALPEFCRNNIFPLIYMCNIVKHFGPYLCLLHLIVSPSYIRLSCMLTSEYCVGTSISYCKGQIGKWR